MELGASPGSPTKEVPVETVSESCKEATNRHRTTIYISGRYLKFSRNVSQSRWIIDDERMGEASVEEIVGSKILPKCRGDSYKFHAAGREDIDVRMLGTGRPFLVEVVNPRCIPNFVDIEEITTSIGKCQGGAVKVTNLKVVGTDVWTLMRKGEAEKQKQYAALVWVSCPLKDDDLQLVSAIKDMEILQNTPIRVLHRRSPLERKRIIHWMKIQKIAGSCQYFLLHLCTQWAVDKYMGVGATMGGKRRAARSGKRRAAARSRRRARRGAVDEQRGARAGDRGARRGDGEQGDLYSMARGGQQPRRSPHTARAGVSSPPSL